MRAAVTLLLAVSALSLASGCRDSADGVAVSLACTTRSISVCDASPGSGC